MNGRFGSAAGPGLSREEHPAWHLAAELHESLDPAQDADGALRVFQQVGLTAVVLEREPDLWAVGRHCVGPGTREEPHQASELRDAGHEEEEELYDERRHRAEERHEALEDVADPVEEEHERRDAEEDQQAPLVVLEHVSARRDDPSGCQFTPTT